MRGGGAAVECDVAMLPLLFTAARCERTLQTTHKKKNTVQEHGSVCMQQAGLWGLKPHRSPDQSSESKLKTGA